MSNRPTMREALQLIVNTDPVDAALDPQRAVRIARAALAKPEAQMPELPTPMVHWRDNLPLVGGGAVKAGMYWNADQMRAYGQACADAARAAAPTDRSYPSLGPRAWHGSETIAPLATPEGEVVVTKNEAGQIVAVTRQDSDGQILSVIAEAAAPQSVEPEFYFREWDGDDSDLGGHVVVHKDEFRDNGPWYPLYLEPPTTPTPSEWVEEAMRLADEFADQGLFCGLCMSHDRWAARDALRAHLSTLPKARPE